MLGQSPSSAKCANRYSPAWTVQAGMVLAALLESADWGAACSFMRATIKLAGA